MLHLACVMDGNRRWAKKKGWMPWVGHRQGIEAMRIAVEFCLEKKISYASFYTFSIENLKRSETEKNYMFDLLVQEAEKNLDLFLQKGARVRFVGDKKLFPASVVPVCERMEQQTAHLTTLQVNFLFCYGGRQEILSAVNELINEVREGTITQAEISHELLSKKLWTGDIPEPDLIIRTGGVHRLSGFLTYQSAYTELYFLDKFWPDLTKQDLEDAYAYFNACKRNFGV